jgi:hypothetical protein
MNKLANVMAQINLLSRNISLLFQNTYLRELRVDGRIILKWIFKKWDAGRDWSTIGTGGSFM